MVAIVYSGDMRTCSLDECNNKHKGFGLCENHLKKFKRGNLPRYELPPAACVSSDDERMDRYVNKTETCWLWTGAKTTAGYGIFTESRKNHYAHRWAYRMLVGPIPDGLDLDHLCRVRHCCNPGHLEPVTRKVNLNRGAGFGGALS